ncbi:MAG: N-acetylmuramoyl-L-alanine amidase [Lachnospiraceae bacterium]|nr:N-acetylmuramoyl-L-alanine amidase [Lachnospiraceae bacterium]
MNNVFFNNKYFKMVTLGILLTMVLMLSVSCGKKTDKKSKSTTTSAPVNEAKEDIVDNLETETPEEDIEDVENPVVEETEAPIVTEKPVVTQAPVKTPEPQKTTAPVKTQETMKPQKKSANASDHLIVIDPGHQAKGNNEKEPVAPGSSTTKAKVASGTTGVSSKVPEYVVTLQVGLKLRDILKERGYQVKMIRETHDVNISNAERAQIANDAGADAFIRIHCNGVDNSSVRGALTMNQTKNNPYCGEYYSLSRKLSENVIDSMCAATGLKNKGVSETDTMSGINWCTVPVTIVEMGFMSNPEEDMLLVDDSFQNKIAEGMADGIDNYFNY